MAKRGRHRMGDLNSAFVDTKLACSGDNRRSLRIISRDIVRSKCIDRMVECMSGREVVVADCPSPSSRDHFESQVRKHAEALRLAKGG